MDHVSFKSRTIFFFGSAKNFLWCIKVGSLEHFRSKFTENCTKITKMLNIFRIYRYQTRVSNFYLLQKQLFTIPNFLFQKFFIFRNWKFWCWTNIFRIYGVDFCGFRHRSWQLHHHAFHHVLELKMAETQITDITWTSVLANTIQSKA